MRTFRLERNPDFSRCAMLLDAQFFEIVTAMQKLNIDFFEYNIKRGASAASVH